jgi:polyisoprenoid-binding protein YceI
LLTVLRSTAAEHAPFHAQQAQVRFEGAGAAGFRLEGKTRELTLNDDGTQLTFHVSLSTLQTGIALRDQHMREKYLEVAHYPEAVLQVSWNRLTLPAPGVVSNADIPAQLTLHGQTHDVVPHVELKRGSNGLHVHATFPIDMRDFGIVPPNYLGITVKPNVQIEVELDAQTDAAR